MDTTRFFDAASELRNFDPALNAFELFGIALSPRLDPVELRKTWRALSRQLHPDRFRQHGSLNAVRAEAWSSALNGAWRLLSSPSLRLAEFLRLRGVALPEGKVTQDFLMEMFEVNEELEDGVGSPERAAELEADLRRRVEGVDTALAALCDEAESATDLTSIATRLSQLDAERHYFERLLKTLHQGPSA